MEDKPLSHEDSLKLINSVISNAKGYFYESGMGALIWGFTNVICFVLDYLEVKDIINLPFSPYFLMAIAFILQFYFGRKEKRLREVSTYADNSSKFVWIAFATSVFTLTIAGGFGKIGYVVLPVLLLLFAIPTFVTGCLHRFNPFIAGGIICWLLSCIAFLYKSDETILLVAAGAFFAWVVPGFILRQKYYKRPDGF